MQQDALPLFKKEKVQSEDIGDNQNFDDDYDGKLEEPISENILNEDDDDCNGNLEEPISENILNEDDDDCDGNLEEPISENILNEDDGDNIINYDEGDNNVPSSNGDRVSMLEDVNEDDDEAGFKTTDSNIWTLPANRDDCTLEEIRRGQVINSIAPNECPVIGCGKKINDTKLDPSPGTIASGLRTHVLFVHYANRKPAKKRKLCWSTKRRSQPSPKKPIGGSALATSSRREFEADILSSTAASLSTSNIKSKNHSNRSQAPGSLLSKKINEMVAKTNQMSSLQSLMQATYGSRMESPNRQNQQPPPTQTTKNPEFDNIQKNSFNQTTSSLFSILAGLTQQQPNSNPAPRKSNQQNNTVSLSQCSRNSSMNVNTSNRSSVNSSLLSLLNENVTNSLPSQLKKSLIQDSRGKIPTSRHSNSLLNNSTNYQLNHSNNDVIFSNNHNNSSILSSLCSGSGEVRSSYDNSMPLNSFVESLAIKTGANIGPAGVAEAKKIIEKFTKSLLCSSQTIADHYLAPYVGESPQQKPEISPSDIMLAYKMMHKSHGQP